MAALNAAIMENERSNLNPSFTQNVSQMEGGVPVIKGQTNIPVGKAVENPGYTTNKVIRRPEEDPIFKSFQAKARKYGIIK